MFHGVLHTPPTVTAPPTVTDIVVILPLITPGANVAGVGANATADIVEELVPGDIADIVMGNRLTAKVSVVLFDILSRDSGLYRQKMVNHLRPLWKLVPLKVLRELVARVHFVTVGNYIDTVGGYEAFSIEAIEGSDVLRQQPVQ